MKDQPDHERRETYPAERLDALGLAELLSTHRDTLLRRWLRLDRAIAPDGCDEDELRDDVPAFVTVLIESLRRARPGRSAREDEHRSAVAHGLQRLSIGFDIATMVREYGLLRACIFDLVEEQGLTLDPAASRALLDLIMQEIGAAAAVYAGEQRRQQAAIERELRRRAQEAELSAAIGKALTSTQPLQVQLQCCTDEMVPHLGAALARIWTVDATEAFELQASSGCLTHTDGSHERVAFAPHKLGLIAKERRPHVTNDVQSDLPWAAREGVVSFAGYPLLVEGRLVGVVAFFANEELAEDVTATLASIADQIAVAIDRARTHEELQASEQHFRTLADFTPQLVWVADPSGAISWYNQRWYDYTGTTREEMLGWGWQSVHAPDQLPRVVARFKHAIATGEPWEDLFPLRRADGTFRWFLSRAMPVRDAHGRILRWIGTNTDVEERRRAEAALKDRVEFEQELVGIVSHDLRNPLQAIMLGAQAVLGREGLDDRTSAVLARIQSSAERALRLIRDLLDFTQARLGGGLRIARKSMDLAEVAAQIVDEVGVAFANRRIEVENDGRCRGEWDPDRMAQLVMNLVTNATKYSPSESKVRVTTHGDGRDVLLTVHNDGPPIPPELLPHLFEPLQRGSARPDTSGRSIGLGLYIVRKIVEAHDGRVDVTSTPESGTTFTVRLPSRVE